MKIFGVYNVTDGLWVDAAGVFIYVRVLPVQKLLLILGITNERGGSKQMSV